MRRLAVSTAPLSSPKRSSVSAPSMRTASPVVVQEARCRALPNTPPFVNPRRSSANPAHLITRRTRMHTQDVVLCQPVRTAIGTYNGSLKTVPATELGATAILETLSRAGLDGARIDTVVMG